jgi:hypothetical protein
MAVRHRVPVLALVLVPALAPPLFAQAPSRKAECAATPVVPKIDGCVVRECDVDEYDEAEMQTGPVDGSGDFPKRLVEGKYSAVTYLCPRTTSTAEIARRTMAALRRSGYAVVYSGRMYHSDLPGFTAHKAKHWVQVVSEAFDDGSGYTVTSVQAVLDEPLVEPAVPGTQKGRQTTR